MNLISSATPSALPRQPGFAEERRRLLHINHPPMLLRLVERFCRSKNLEVHSLENAVQGLHHALTGEYDLVVLGAPALGMEAGRVLKGLLRADARVPVLILADRHTLDKRDFSVYPNVRGHLPKPLDLQEFWKHVEGIRRPQPLSPAEKEKLLQVLQKWEHCADAA